MSNITPLDILKAARKRISDRGRWTTGWYAKDAARQKTYCESLEAVCWCASGAVYRQGLAIYPYVQRAIVCRDALGHLEDAATELYSLNLFKVNDELGHEAVLKTYDRAIEKAKGQGV
jgi:hypothetical protein